MFDVKKLFNFNEILSKEVIAFSIKSILLLLVWFFLDQVLIIDLGIMSSMQHQGIFILNKITQLDYHATRVYTHANNPIFGMVCANSWLVVAKGCDGKSLMFMLSSFVAIYPNILLKDRVKFGILGLLMIHEFNVLRIVLLSIILQYKPTYFPVMHHYFFQVFMYLVIFLLVNKFLKKQVNVAPK